MPLRRITADTGRGVQSRRVASRPFRLAAAGNILSEVVMTWRPNGRRKADPDAVQPQVRFITPPIRRGSWHLRYFFRPGAAVLRVTRLACCRIITGSGLFQPV